VARQRHLQPGPTQHQLEVAPTVTAAYEAIVRATVRIIAERNTQIAALEAELMATFEQHADAAVLGSLPGLGPVLGARVLAEFGDDPARYPDAKARKAYAGTAPSHAPQARATPCSRGWRATATWPMPATAGRTRPCVPHPVVAPTTMPIALATRRIRRPSAPLPTAWSAFSTAASSTTSRCPDRCPDRVAA
jgi:Transposase IS116/IS110/IS902 family